MKIIKKVRRIMLFINILFLMYIIAGLIFLILNIGILPDNWGTTNDITLRTTGATASITVLLQSAQKIDEYMADNEYYYTTSSNSYNTLYNVGSSKATCCATYVSWCLQDAGLITEHTNSVDGIISILSNNSDWEKVDVSDWADMQAGDIGIYQADGDSHTNIYAGNSKFWDAGTDTKVQGKGVTSHRLPSSYVFRYTK